MNKIVCIFLLLCSIEASYAQETNKARTEKTFELPPNHAQRRFVIELDKGNKLQIEVSNMDDLNRFLNMDSVLRIFLQDIEPLKDSLTDELSSKRIDYLTDSSGLKKIRFQQFKPKGSSFLITGNDVASLKLEQDTINFIGSISYRAKYGFRKELTETRHYKLSFFVNQLSDLASYMNSSLNGKISLLQQQINTTWITTKQKGVAYLKSDESISARLPKGYVAGGDFLNFRLSVDAQNYKNYFIPSFTLGAGLIFSKPYWKREFVLAWEPNFLFSQNAQGKLKTFRNDFLTLTAAQGPIKDGEPRKESHFLTIISFGYLIKREGDYFEKGTMRLGAGRLSIFDGKTKLEPALYFTNVFKGVTPGLRWIQSF